MSQPLLRVACLFAMGVVLDGFQDPGIVVWTAILILGSLGFTLFQSARRWLPFLLLIAAGGWNHSLHATRWSSNDLRALEIGLPALADVRGTLSDRPRTSSSTFKDKTTFNTMAELRVKELRLNATDWRPAVGRIVVSTRGTLGRAFHDGAQVEVSGVLSRPGPPRAPGLFDYGRYLAGKGIAFQLRVDTEHDWRSIEPDASARTPWTDRFIDWARHTLSLGLPADDPAVGLVQAMTLGWKPALTDEIREPFMKSGTLHVFAISGLHIALIGGMLLAVLRLLRLPRSICGTVVIPVLWFYTLATGAQSSAVRASVMMTIVLCGWSLKRPSNLINSMSGAALLILIVAPRQLFQASFQLSFAVVLSLALIVPPLRNRLVVALQPDPLLPARLVSPWQRRFGTPLRWLMLTMATAFAAWVGSMPLLAVYFHLLSPGTILANVALVPCAGAALASALASLAAGAWCPWLSEVFNHGAWFWMHCMMRISESISNLPGTWRHVPSPSPAVLAVYYGTLLGLAFRQPKPSQLRRVLPIPVFLLLGLLIWNARLRRTSATLAVVPLNGGMAVEVKPAGHWLPVLIDCGNPQAFQSTLAPFLRAEGHNRIDTLVLTHGDVRHMGAATDVLKAFPPDQVVISSVSFRSRVWRATLQRMNEEEIRLRQVNRGDRIAGFEILHPPEGLKAARADEAPLVLRTILRGNRVLLLSDLNRQGQRLLLDAVDPALLRASIVVTGLPDDGEPLIDDLVQRVRPELVVVADDDWPSYRRASPELLARLAAGGATVIDTRTAGGIRLEFDEHGWTATDARHRLLAEADRRNPHAGAGRKNLQAKRRWIEIHADASDKNPETPSWP